MAFQFLDLSVQNGVGWLRFNRAPRNSVHAEMLAEVRPAFETLTADTAVKVIVLASAVPEYFSTGADLMTFKESAPDDMVRWVNETHSIAEMFRASQKPVLSAIDGVAVGGGLEMSLHTDLRFAADRAKFGQPEINIAFIPPVAGTQGLVRLVGRSAAFRILYGGEIFDAKAALKMGLVDEVLAHQDLEAHVQHYGETLAQRPANALAAIRRCLVDGGALPFDEGLAIERTQAIALAEHPNFKEGVSAFLEKRPPDWR